MYPFQWHLRLTNTENLPHSSLSKAVRRNIEKNVSLRQGKGSALNGYANLLVDSGVFAVSQILRVYYWKSVIFCIYLLFRGQLRVLILEERLQEIADQFSNVVWSLIMP